MSKHLIAPNLNAIKPLFDPVGQVILVHDVVGLILLANKVLMCEQWVTHLYDMIKKCCILATVQFREADRTLLAVGNLSLRPAYTEVSAYYRSMKIPISHVDLPSTTALSY